ncbi:oligopeptide transporter, OPT family [Planctomycetales bacterium ZRK34]|nr:oligopeptide transporter, OPT family [Planctomycetales bacterium ZRK34]
MADSQLRSSEPHIPAATSLPEITPLTLLLGVGLAMLLGAANVYLGLKAGMTVAASIPAAVISMGVFKALRRGNILQNNAVQTAASAGESLAAGVIFTIPSLLILGAWDHFDYWTTTLIAALGGLIGVMFTVPLRRALVVAAKLKFPEGVATAEVLKVGDHSSGAKEPPLPVGEGWGEGAEQSNLVSHRASSTTGAPSPGPDGPTSPRGRGGAEGASVKPLVVGSAIGAVFKVCESGLRLFAGNAEVAGRIGSSVGYAGISLAPALIGVGYIVGLNIAVLIFLGGAINWYIAIPILATQTPAADAASAGAADFAWSLWSTQTRYIGVGAMVVGGLWALIRLMPSLVEGVRSGLDAFRAARDADAPAPDRTERDAPLPWVIAGIVVSVVPLYFVFSHVLPKEPAGVVAFMAGAMLVAGFLFSAVASYMAGLVGSSNNPISGVTIATILCTALLLLWIGTGTADGPVAAILIGAVVCCAAAIGGDNMQDLKTGHLLGATPWKQQVMQVVGVTAAAFVMAPVLTLLLHAYGIGPIHTEGQQPLAAPQASLMASVARGVFERNLPWTMVIIGAGVAVAVITLDVVLEKKNAAFRTPVLAVAVGLYLPLELGTVMFAGGLIAWAADRFHLRRFDDEAEGEMQSSMVQLREAGQRRGLLLAAGLITGEAILGILLAIPIVINEGVNPLSIGLEHPPSWPGLLLLAGVAGLLYRAATSRRRETVTM